MARLPTGEARQRICDVAIELFAKKGYQQITMRDIAAAVGIRASSIYNHYKSKEELFAAILTEIDDAISSEPIHARQSAVDELLSQLPFIMIKKTPRIQQMIKIIMMEQYTNNMACAFFEEKLMREPTERLTATIVNLCRDNLIKPCNAQETAVQLNALALGMMTTAMHAVTTTDTQESMRRAIERMFLS